MNKIPCSVCGHQESREVWFSDGETKYSKPMCEACVTNFQNECKELYDLIQERLASIQERLASKASWWKRLFKRKDS